MKQSPSIRMPAPSLFGTGLLTLVGTALRQTTIFTVPRSPVVPRIRDRTSALEWRASRGNRVLACSVLPRNPAESQGLAHVSGAGVIAVPQRAEFACAVQALDGVSPHVEYLGPGVSLWTSLGIEKARPHRDGIVGRSSKGNER